MKKILFFIIFFLSFYARGDIWFAPNSTEMLNSRKDDHLWQESRKDIKVFKFYSNVIQSATSESLNQKFEFLKKNNIKVAIELPGLTWEQENKGYKIEGFQRSGFTRDIIKKIQQAGGTVDYIALDEPVFFGSYKKGSKYTSLSAEQLAKQIYENMKPIYSVFPNVKVGDIEPINQMSKSFYSTFIPQWIDEYKKISGREIDFFHLDLYWQGDWKTAIFF